MLLVASASYAIRPRPVSFYNQKTCASPYLKCYETTSTSPKVRVIYVQYPELDSTASNKKHKSKNLSSSTHPYQHHDLLCIPFRSVSCAWHRYRDSNVFEPHPSAAALIVSIGSNSWLPSSSAATYLIYKIRIYKSSPIRAKEHLRNPISHTKAEFSSVFY